MAEKRLFLKSCVNVTEMAAAAPAAPAGPAEETLDDLALTEARKWYSLDSGDDRRAHLVSVRNQSPFGSEIAQKMLIHIAILVLFEEWPRSVLESLIATDRASVQEILDHDADAVNNGSLPASDGQAR
jgi:hypothetical protein